MTPIIDTHQHLWDLSRLNLPWTKGLELMDRDHLMPDYIKAKENTGIEGTVYMEVDVDSKHWDREVEDMSVHCSDDDTPMKAMVIGGDPLSDDFAIYLERHSSNPYVKGIRRVLHGPDTGPGHCLKLGFIEGIRKIGKAGLLFGICIRPAELMDAVSLVKQCPETTFVLDHCGNADPYIVSGMDDPGTEPDGSPFWHTRKGWYDAISALGAQSNVVCKISGIVARAREGWNAETLAPTIDTCLDSFGSERVVFGSDWPVCKFGAELTQWTVAFRKVLSKRDDLFQRNVMYANVESLYDISL